MILLNNQVVEFQRFPNQEKRLDLDKSLIQDVNDVVWQYENDESIFEFVVFTSILKRREFEMKILRNVIFNLRIPYMPYSRMDRINDSYTAFTLSALINTLRSSFESYDSVEILDPHSPKTLELFKLFTRAQVPVSEVEFSLHREVLKTRDLENTWVVFPDRGAQLRYAEDLDVYPNVIVCEKKRDFETGEILGIEAKIVKQSGNSSTISDAIIIDDLCSYGGTFIGCKKSIIESGLKPQTWSLCVTHSEKAMIDGKALNEFDNVYTTNSIQDERRRDYAQIVEFDVLKMK